MSIRTMFRMICFRRDPAAGGLPWKDTPRNSDARPALMLAQLRYWLRHFAMEYWIPVLTGLIIVLCSSSERSAWA